MLHHIHLYLVALLVLQHSHHIVYLVLACGCHALDGGETLHLEGHHNLEQLVILLHLTQPVAFLHAVTWLGDGHELPLAVGVQRLGILAALEEDALHLVQVILQSVVVLAEHTGAQLDFQHVSGELRHGTHLQATGALKHLHEGILPCDLDDLRHQSVASCLYVAYLSLHHGSVHADGDHVGDYTTYSSFSHCMYCLLFTFE